MIARHVHVLATGDIDVGARIQRPDILAGSRFDLANCLRWQVHHSVNVTGQEGVQTCDRVTNAEMLDLVEISAFAPVIVKARTNGADTGLELLDLVGACTDGRGEILGTFLQDLKVEGAKGDRKIRVR